MAVCHSKRRARIAPARLVAVLLLALALIPGVALANGPEIGFDGSTIFPLESHAIRLLREVVVMSPGRGGADAVMAWYTLVNLTDRPRSFDMSFVVNPYEAGYSSYEPGQSPRVFLVDQELPVRWKALKPGTWRDFVTAGTDSLPTWHLSMAPRDTVVLHINYPSSWSGGAEGNGIYQTYTYHARPAALWAGTIGVAEFRICLGDHAPLFRNSDPWSYAVSRVNIEPAGSWWEGDCLHWRFENWEPDGDITLSVEGVEPSGSSEFLELIEDAMSSPRRRIELPAYVADQRRLERSSLLEELRSAFLAPGLYPTAVLPNYVPFAQAWLLLRRSEISARHGGRCLDETVARYFNSLAWYRDTPPSAAPVLSDTERANQVILAELARVIAGNHDALVPLPKVKSE